MLTLQPTIKQNYIGMYYGGQKILNDQILAYQKMSM
jgi:hypothetical protein